VLIGESNVAIDPAIGGYGVADIYLGEFSPQRAIKSQRPRGLNPRVKNVRTLLSPHAMCPQLVWSLALRTGRRAINLPARRGRELGLG